MRTKFFDKRGDSEVLNSTVVFLILNLLFFASMFYFVGKTTSNTALLEQAYAKEIAYILDNAEEGMNITVGIKELYDTAEKNGYGTKPGETVVNINKETNNITIKVKEKTSYTYQYFTRYENLVIDGDGRTQIIIRT